MGLEKTGCRWGYDRRTHYSTGSGSGNRFEGEIHKQVSSIILEHM